MSRFNYMVFGRETGLSSFSFVAPDLVLQQHKA